MGETPDYEKYIGGFYSILLMIGYGRRAILGYGTYFTSRGFIGLGHGQRPSFDKFNLLMPQNLSQDENNRTIEELDQRKQVDVPKDNILRLDLKMPRLFRQGHLQIIQTTGEPTSFGRRYGKEELYTLYFGRKRPAEQLQDLLKAFNEEILTLL
jgi:hypothetical protein